MSTHTLITLTALSAMLAIAVRADLASHRIPNALCATGIVVAFALQAAYGGSHGVIIALVGAGAGFLCFAPFYLLGAMGAGDVKLLTAIGAFLGPQCAITTALLSLIAGGIAAVTHLTWRAVRARTTGSSVMAAIRVARRERIAYALPIALGSIAAAWLQVEPIKTSLSQLREIA